MGSKITPQELTSCNKKVLMKLDRTQTLKQQSSFLGSVHRLTKFIHKLRISEILRPLLKNKKGQIQQTLAQRISLGKIYKNQKKDKTSDRI